MAQGLIREGGAAAESGKVSMLRVSLDTAEVGKLDATARKRFIMLTSIARDMTILQRFLVLSGRREAPEHPAETSAEAIHIVFLMATLGSKLHEAKSFYNHEGILADAPASITEERDEVEAFFGDPMVEGILWFIRDKFGFHYDHYDDLDPKIDSAFSGLGR